MIQEKLVSKKPGIVSKQWSQYLRSMLTIEIFALIVQKERLHIVLSSLQIPLAFNFKKQSSGG
jgi:hypothetical protein